MYLNSWKLNVVLWFSICGSKNMFSSRFFYSLHLYWITKEDETCDIPLCELQEILRLAMYLFFNHQQLLFQAKHGIKAVLDFWLFPTNTPRVFHVETTWKRSLLSRFNIKHTWCTFRIVHKIIITFQGACVPYVILDLKSYFNMKI